jgi:hypothetical protein
MNYAIPLVFDLMPVEASQRVITPGTNYLTAPARLSRTGLQRYRARELVGEDGQQIFADKQPDDIVTLLRPEDEVSDPESIASFEDMPITDMHPDRVTYPNGVTSDNWKQLAIGHVRDCKWQAKDGYVGGRVRINDATAISNVFSGRSQLSVGYGFECDKQAGVHSDGQPYHGIMRKVRGNHLAVTDVARGGPGCRIADHQPNEDKTMATVKMTIDSVDYEVPEGTAATLVKKLSGERDDARTTLRAKEEAHGAAVSKLVSDHGAELAKLREGTIPKTDVDALVNERVVLLADCGAHCPEVKPEGLTSAELRRKMVSDLSTRHTSVKNVVDAVLAGVALDKASDDQIRTACNAAVASVKGSTQDASKRRDDIAHAFSADGSKTKKKEAAASDGGDEIPDMSTETYLRKNFIPGQKPAGK